MSHRSIARAFASEVLLAVVLFVFVLRGCENLWLVSGRKRSPKGSFGGVNYFKLLRAAAIISGRQHAWQSVY